jgi:hypothetical protein
MRLGSDGDGLPQVGRKTTHNAPPNECLGKCSAQEAIVLLAAILVAHRFALAATLDREILEIVLWKIPA